MIRADERELETQTRQRYMRIHEKEVKLFSDNFAVLATNATFLSGLGFGALHMETGFLEREHGEVCSDLAGCGMKVRVALTAFYTLAAISIGFNLLSLVLASQAVCRARACALPPIRPSDPRLALCLSPPWARR